MRLSWVTEGQLPVIRHHTSHSGTTPAADDPVLYGATIPAAGCPGPTGGPMDGMDAAADTCRASWNYSTRKSVKKKNKKWHSGVTFNGRGEVRKFILDSLNDLMQRQIDWRLSGEKTLGQHLSRLRPPSEEAECVTTHATRQAGGKNKQISFFFCLAVLAAVLQLRAPAWIRGMSDITRAPRVPPTQYHFWRWLSRGQGVGRPHSNSILPASPPTPPSPGYMLPYLPVRSTSLTIWISACLWFSPPTLPASPLSCAPFWLPASTFPNTQPPYLPPQTYPMSLPCSLYPNHLILYSPSVRLGRSSFFVAITSLTLQRGLQHVSFFFAQMT